MQETVLSHLKASYCLDVDTAKCFGSYVEDIMFRHPVGGDGGSRTRGIARLGSPNYLLAACCKSCYLCCLRAFFLTCPASEDVA